MGERQKRQHFCHHQKHHCQRYMVMDKNTGVTVQRIQTKADKVRSDVSYYNGRIYFSTQSGYLYSYNLTADGKVDLENLIEPSGTHS